jgi:hypothetical protein
MAVLVVVAADRDRRGRTVPAGLRRATAAGAIAAPCLLLGVVAALALYIQSVTKAPLGFTGVTPSTVVHAVTGGDHVVTAIPTTGSVGYGSTFSIGIDNAYRIGGCLWLALGAAGCAVIAALACLLRDRWAAVSVPDGPSGRL